MAKRRVVSETGSGITRYRYERESYDLTKPVPEDEARELVEGIKRAAARPLWDKENIVKAVERELARVKADLPADHDDWDFLPHADFGWYYCELIRLDRIVRDAIEKGEAGRAALFAADFGACWTELQIKLTWEERALWGSERLKELDEAAKAQRKWGREDRIAAVQAVLDRGKLGITAAIKAAAKQNPGRGGWKAFELDWYSQKKAP